MKRLFVAALKEEVPNLDFFHFTGVGKINATHTITQLILKHKPEEIVNFGSVGSLNKEIKGLIEVTKFYQRDMDVRGLMNLKLGETPFDSIHEIITNDAGYSCGTGDSFVQSKIEMNVDVVDMEAYALAKICKLHNVDFKCFKFISDNADENASNDWLENCKKGSQLFLEKAKNFSWVK
jgi:adenosylhomocysteine nucleosidase|tara:strand:+ start:1255 stop:1791 length:537 start_codon:yes stop_codon:yes gene_type:complete